MPLATLPTQPPQLISTVSRSSPCGVNMVPRIISPHKNMVVMAASSSTPRPVRLSSRWPPPGTSQPSATAGAQTRMLTGSFSAFSSVFSFAIGFL